MKRARHMCTPFIGSNKSRLEHEVRIYGHHLTNISWSRWNSKATKHPKICGCTLSLNTPANVHQRWTVTQGISLHTRHSSLPSPLSPSLGACIHKWPTPSTPLLCTLKRRGSFEMEVVPAGKPRSSFRSHHFRLLSLLLNNLGCYNKRISIYMEFSLAKMHLKDAAVIMNNKTRCLPFFFFWLPFQKKGKEKRGDGRGRKWCKKQTLWRRKSRQVYGWIPTRVFNCMKISTTTKYIKWGSSLFYSLSGSLFQGTSLRSDWHRGCRTGPLTAWNREGGRWLGGGV